MEITAENLGVKALKTKLTELEKKALKIIPVPTAKITANGYNGYSQYINEVPQEVKDIYPTTKINESGRRSNLISDSTELGRLIDGKHSALDIKKMLDAQGRSTSDLQAIMNYIEILKIAGLVEK
jgi:hypothetical protein